MAADDIPFDRSIDAKPDQPVQVSPLLRRIIANNGGPFTFTGTCSYIVGRRAVTVIDPGPNDPMHLRALLDAIGAAPVRQILVTHTHRDHSPGAAALKAATGAPILGGPMPGAPRTVADMQQLDAVHDRTYTPDRVLADGETIAGEDHRLTVLATPGHTANHLAFALDDEAALLSGDHVMAWSTTVVAPPDGSMRAYLGSLERLKGRDDITYWPGHGGPVRQPQRFVRALLHHRRQREHAILARLRAGDRTVPAIVAAIYEGLPVALRGAAGLSVLAHLEDLIERGLVTADGGTVVSGRFEPAGPQMPSPASP